MIKLGFGNRCLVALISGLVFGYYLPDGAVTFIAPVGSAFLQLLKLIIVPLTFTTIVASFAKLEDLALVQRLGLRTLMWFVITALIAATLGLGVAQWIKPGVGLSLGDSSIQFQGRQLPLISDTLLDMLPGNLIGQIAAGKVIPVIIFAIMFGLALTACGERTPTVRKFFSEFAEVMFKITRKIIRLSPYGIFALVVPVSHNYGIATVLPLFKFIAAVYVACGLQLVVYALLLLMFAKVKPWRFVRQVWPAMITGFTTSSSLGTLPVTLEVLVERAGVPPAIAGFVAPLGATMKMDGCGAIYPAIICALTAQIYGIELSYLQYALIIFTAAVATIGTAGVPGTASIMATVVLASAGLPLTGLALVIGIDKIVDMMRTMTNVTGTLVCTSLVAKSGRDIKL